MISSSGILTDEQQDGLFSLDVIKGGAAEEGKKGAKGGKGASALARVSEASAPGEEDLALLEADSESEVSWGIVCGMGGGGPCSRQTVRWSEGCAGDMYEITTPNGLSGETVTHYPFPWTQDDDEDDEDLDSDDEALRYEAQLEEALEESYTEYLQRRGKREELVKVCLITTAPDLNALRSGVRWNQEGVC